MTFAGKKPPINPRPDVEDEDECSEVRARVQPPHSGEHSSLPPANPPREPKLVERNARLNDKLETARVLLSNLTPSDTHTRLLRLAIVRRDEVLLDGVLRSLETQARVRAVEEERTVRARVALISSLPPSADHSGD